GVGRGLNQEESRAAGGTGRLAVFAFATTSSGRICMNEYTDIPVEPVADPAMSSESAEAEGNRAPALGLTATEPIETAANCSPAPDSTAAKASSKRGRR